MKHIKTVSKGMPANASILGWLGSLKAALQTYIDTLAGQWDGRTADAADGDLGDSGNQ